jgi:hypothetical protein
MGFTYLCGMASRSLQGEQLREVWMVQGDKAMNAITRLLRRWHVLHDWRMRYVGSPLGEGRASGSTHFVIVCRQCQAMRYGGPS